MSPKDTDLLLFLFVLAGLPTVLGAVDLGLKLYWWGKYRVRKRWLPARASGEEQLVGVVVIERERTIRQPAAPSVQVLSVDTDDRAPPRRQLPRK